MKRIACVYAELALLAGLCGLAMTSCSKPEAPGPVRGPVPVVADTVVCGDAPVVIEAIGNVEAYSNVVVRPRVSGAVLNAHFREGDHVRRDQLLFEIDPEPYETILRKAEADLLRDQALSRNAEVEAGRYGDLVKKEYVTRLQADEARARAEALRATVKSDEAAVAEARLNLRYCSIRSPLYGRTGQLITHPGNLARANETALVTIQQIAPIYASFSVPEIQLARIRKAQAAGRLSVEARIPGTEPQQNEKGSLCFVDSQVSSGTGTILLKAVFENADRALWPGQFLNVSMTLSLRRKVVMARSEAIQTGQNGPYVFVITPDLVARRRDVVAGAVVRDRTIVEEGLTEGERVVTDGHLQLTDGSTVVLKAEGMTEQK